MAYGFIGCCVYVPWEEMVDKCQREVIIIERTG